MSGYRAALLALLFGCGATVNDGDVEACVAENPPAEPFDTGSTFGRAQPAPVPGDTPIVLPPPTAEDIATQCRDGGGGNCDAPAFISKEAATCIALERGLAPGLRTWDVSLHFYENHQRVGWGILTVTTETTLDGYSGESMVLDAVSGGELARTFYRAIP